MDVNPNEVKMAYGQNVTNELRHLKDQQWKFAVLILVLIIGIGSFASTNSEILKVTENSYKKIFNIQPIVRAIHAGLECGLFLEKYPYLDMISFGPTIKGAHTPDEKMEIKTVKMFWDLLVDVLENTPKK